MGYCSLCSARELGFREEDSKNTNRHNQKSWSVLLWLVTWPLKGSERGRFFSLWVLCTSGSCSENWPGSFTKFSKLLVRTGLDYRVLSVISPSTFSLTEAREVKVIGPHTDSYLGAEIELELRSVVWHLLFSWVKIWFQMKAVLHLTFIKPSWDSILGSGLCTDVCWSTDTISLVRIGLSSECSHAENSCWDETNSWNFFNFFICTFSRGSNEY